MPNWSFEDTVACPVNGRLYNCKYWVNCRNTPDYNHSCAPLGNSFGVPFNTFGYQQPSTGNSYCDIWTFGTPFPGNYREFIGVPLIQPMVIGHSYFVSFKCSPGSPYAGYGLQTNKQGIRFSTVYYDSVNTAPIDNFAHLYADSIVSDTAGWTTISANFIANSAYTFLTVGNFFDDAHTDTVIPQNNWAFAVYYIDDVEVIDSATAIEEHGISINSISYFQFANELVFKTINNPNKIEFYDEFKNQQFPTMNLPHGLRYGVIAQDIELVLPNLVKQLAHPAVLDEIGNDSIPEVSYLGVNYMELIPILLAGIKDQQVRIDSLVAVIGNGSIAPNPSTGKDSENNSMKVNLADATGGILYQNEPNPFSVMTRINYFIPENTLKATMIFNNILGNIIKEVELIQRGQGTLEVNAENLKSDIYTYSLVIDGKIIDTKRMVKTK